MDNYQILHTLGDGAFGTVLLGKEKESGEQVAIKRMKKKYYTWEECTMLREVKSLTKLSHPNIVKLKSVIRDQNVLHFIFEFMDSNVHNLSEDSPELLTERLIKKISHQVLSALAYTHKHGFFHRDLKPENLLCSGISSDDVEIVKVADFGLARELRSRPPYTSYISTRWYRAPELVLKSTTYSSPIDIWALACIIAELFLLRPLIPGTSEIDQIYKICLLLGTPEHGDWPEGYQLASSVPYRFPACKPTSLKSVVTNASDEMLLLIKDMLSWNPRTRPIATQCMRYNCFSELGRPSAISIRPFASSADVSPKNPGDDSPPLSQRRTTTQAHLSVGPLLRNNSVVTSPRNDFETSRFASSLSPTTNAVGLNAHMGKSNMDIKSNKSASDIRNLMLAEEINLHESLRPADEEKKNAGSWLPSKEKVTTQEVHCVDAILKSLDMHEDNTLISHEYVRNRNHSVESILREIETGPGTTRSSQEDRKVDHPSSKTAFKQPQGKGITTSNSHNLLIHGPSRSRSSPEDDELIGNNTQTRNNDSEAKLDQSSGQPIGKCVTETNVEKSFGTEKNEKLITPVDSVGSIESMLKALRTESPHEMYESKTAWDGKNVQEIL